MTRAVRLTKIGLWTIALSLFTIAYIRGEVGHVRTGAVLAAAGFLVLIISINVNVPGED